MRAWAGGAVGVGRGGTPAAQRDPGGGTTAGGGANREGGARPGGTRQRRRAGPQGGAGPGAPCTASLARNARRPLTTRPSSILGELTLTWGSEAASEEGLRRGCPADSGGGSGTCFVSEQRPCAPSPLRSVPHAEPTYALSVFVQQKGAWERRGGHRSSRR